LMKGRCERIALMFRARRFLALSLRSLLRGDVPLGTFWLGWTETPWTPSGFEGWTTGKKARSIVWGSPSGDAAYLVSPAVPRAAPQFVKPLVVATETEITNKTGARARVSSLPPRRKMVEAESPPSHRAA